MSLNKQPIYLNLLKIRLPVMGVCSILHRITGILIFLGTPFVLWALNSSLKSPEHFESIVMDLQHPVMKFGIWVFLSAFLYHAIAGVRHLIMDMGAAEDLKAARCTAYGTLILSILGALMLGVCLW